MFAFIRPFTLLLQCKHVYHFFGSRFWNAIWSTEVPSLFLFRSFYFINDRMCVSCGFHTYTCTHACLVRGFLAVCRSVSSSGGSPVFLGCGGLDGLSACASASRCSALSGFCRFPRVSVFLSGLAAQPHTPSLDPGRHRTPANVRRGFSPNPLRGGGPPQIRVRTWGPGATRSPG